MNKTSNTAKYLIFYLSTCLCFNHSDKNWQKLGICPALSFKTTTSNKQSVTNCLWPHNETLTIMSHAWLYFLNAFVVRLNKTVIQYCISKKHNKHLAYICWPDATNSNKNKSMKMLLPKRRTFWVFSASSEDKSIVMKKEDKSSKKRTYGNPN